MHLYDYIVLGFYFAFMVGIGLLFRTFNHNISDYFRGGGTMLWWMCGASTIMGSLSVWSFAGAAAKIYETGFVVLSIYICGWLGGLIVYLFTCYRFRQMRVLTSVDAIRRRYGKTTEQFYVWCQVPVGILYAGMGLNTVAVFISSVFGSSLLETLVVVGVIIIFVASLGGAWAVVSGDFVQMLLMLLITSVVVFLTLRLPEINGVSGLLAKLPARHFDWAAVTRPSVVVFWIFALIVQTLLVTNDLSTGAAKFMSVKNGIHARKAALMSLVVSMVLPVVVFIPPLAAVVIYPNLATQFPHLQHPSEGAYVAMSMKVLPQGLLGLMVSGIFALAMAHLDTGLNRNVGIFVNNFYRHIFRPRASDRELLLAGKLCTLIFGALIILIGVEFALHRTANLFDFVIMLGSLIGIPLVIPLALGLFIKRAPSWAGWSTALVDFVAAGVAKWFIGARLFAWAIGTDVGKLNPQEVTDATFATTVCLITFVGSAWYLFTMKLSRFDSVQSRAEIEAFFHDMKTPIDPVAENIVYDDARQYRTLGVLCLIYGTFLLFGVLIPNPLQGRLCFLYIGGTMSLLGGWLLFYGKKTAKPVQETEPVEPIVPVVAGAPSDS